MASNMITPPVGWLLDNGELEYAPKTITIPGEGTIVNPDLEQYRRWNNTVKILPYEDETPPPSRIEGYEYVKDGYRVGKTAVTTKWTLVKIKAEDQPETSATSYSRIFLKIALANIGKLEAFENLLQTIEIAPGYTAKQAFDDANVIRTDFPKFDEYLNQICTALEIDPPTRLQILNSCIAKI